MEIRRAQLNKSEKWNEKKKKDWNEPNKKSGMKQIRTVEWEK